MKTIFNDENDDYSDELDDTLKPLKHYYLGDPEEIRKAMEAVANQGRAKK